MPDTVTGGVPNRLPDAVVFDWDSTLADNWVAIAAALNATLVRFGLEPWSEAHVREQATVSARARFPSLFGNHAREAEEHFYRQLARRHLDAIRPLPGAVRLLALLDSADVPMAIVSNKAGEPLRAEVDRLGWTGYFVRIVGAGDAPHDKPAPDPVHLALAGCELPGSPAIWFVGDSAVDLQCARASGCVGILIVAGAIADADLAACPPAARFASCTDLAAAVDKILSTRP